MVRLNRCRAHDVHTRAYLGWGAFGAASTIVCLLAIVSASQGVSEFIYFNF